MTSKNVKTISLSLSLACIASGATASVYDSTNNKQYDNSDNLASNLFVKPDVSGVKTAKLYTLGGMIGSSKASGAGGTSAMESCYSNCHNADLSQACRDNGYTLSSACSSGYAKVLCPMMPILWRCDCHTDTVQQCIDSGYSNTSCSTGYTLSGQCPNNTAYYNSCNCHTDCAALKSDALDSTYDSGDMFGGDLDWEGTTKPVLATGITGSGAVSISSVPWYTSLSAAQQIINATASDLLNYNVKCSGNLTWSCYSNCHTEGCTDSWYLANGVNYIATDSTSWATAVSSATASSTVLVKGDVEVDTGRAPTMGKIVGEQYFSQCSYKPASSLYTTYGSGQLFEVRASTLISNVTLKHRPNSTGYWWVNPTISVFNSGLSPVIQDTTIDVSGTHPTAVFPSVSTSAVVNNVTIKYNQTTYTSTHEDSIFHIRLGSSITFKGTTTITSNVNKFIGVGEDGYVYADAGAKIIFNGTCYKFSSAFTKYISGGDQIIATPAGLGLSSGC